MSATKQRGFFQHPQQITDKDTFFTKLQDQLGGKSYLVISTAGNEFIGKDFMNGEYDSIARLRSSLGTLAVFTTLQQVYDQLMRFDGSKERVQNHSFILSLNLWHQDVENASTTDTFHTHIQRLVEGSAFIESVQKRQPLRDDQVLSQKNGATSDTLKI
jgi:hypothetical protein